MTSSAPEHEEFRKPNPEIATFTQKTSHFPLPLVSVIVVNYNYSEYLAQAVESVMAQTYPCIECIIIDDCSTDNSRDMMRDFKRKYSQITNIFNEENRGPAGSMLYAVSKSSGSYVIFLDADDILLPTCVETHVVAHLSLRVPVGLTSVDMQQIYEGRVVTTAFPCFAGFVRGRAKPDPTLVRYFDLSADIPRPAIGREEISELVHYVDPTEAGGWPWSPTSGNCFRQDALRLVTNNERLATLRSGVDCYLLRGVGVLTGSALIDIPLVGYRLHGKNDFVKGCSLHQIRPYDNENLKLVASRATRMLIDHLVENASDYVARLEEPVFYRQALDALENVYPPIKPEGLSYVTGKLIAERERLRKVLGVEEYDSWIAYRFLPARLLHFPIIGRLLRRIWTDKIIPNAAARDKARLQ